MNPAAEIDAALAALFPPNVGHAAVAIKEPLPALWLGEGDAVATALPVRRREFAAGRAAARLALTGAGAAAVPLRSLDDRTPDWPEGFRGSIAHSSGFAVAVAGPASAWAGLGIDIEPAGQVPGDLHSTILRAEERDLDLTAAFCAKEAVQKAIFPVCRTLMEFHDLLLKGDREDFAAELRRPAGPLSAGTRVRGRWTFAAGHVLAGVSWPAIAARNIAPSLAASTPAS